ARRAPLNGVRCDCVRRRCRRIDAPGSRAAVPLLRYGAVRGHLHARRYAGVRGCRRGPRLQQCGARHSGVSESTVRTAIKVLRPLTRGRTMYATVDGIRLYWERSGTGEPLLLIQGLGFSADMWYRIVPALEKHFTVIRYDARGIGRSDAPPGPYPFALAAADAIAILDAGGEGTTWPDAEVMAVLTDRTELPLEESIRATEGFAYAASTPKSDIDEDVRRRMELPNTRQGYEGQLMGTIGFP